MATLAVSLQNLNEKISTTRGGHDMRVCNFYNFHREIELLDWCGEAQSLLVALIVDSLFCHPQNGIWVWVHVY